MAGRLRNVLTANSLPKSARCGAARTRLFTKVCCADPVAPMRGGINASDFAHFEECTMSVTDAAMDAEVKGKPKDATRFAKDQLKAIVERIEHLEEEKKAIADDIKDVYAEAKGNGYDVKALRKIIRLRKQDKNERAEEEAILETYMHALGMI
jgi:uncharacterized protein (UPF0335 family)